MERSAHQQRACLTELAGDGGGIFAAQGHLLEVGEDISPLWRVGEIASVAGDQLLEDMDFELVPGGTVAAIRFVTLERIVVAVAGAVVDADGERLEEGLDGLLQPGALPGGGVKAHDTAEGDVYDWLGGTRGGFGIIARPLAALALEASVEGSGIGHAVYTEGEAEEGAARVDDMLGGVARLIYRQIIRVDRDDVVAAFPGAFFCAPGFG